MAVSATPDPAPEAKGWEHYYELGRRRFAEGDASGAESAFRDAIKSAESPAGDPLQLASSLSSLGQLKYQQKDYAQAEDCFQRALKLRERALGRDHPVVISGINNLAASFVARGALDEAEPLLQRAMQVTVKRVEATQSELSVNLNNLVRLYVKRGDYTRAEPLLVQLLALKRPLGPEHPDVAAVLVTLAKLRFSMGRPADAERLWRRVLTVREKALPPNDLIIAGTIDGLADTCAAQNKRVEELEFRERALTVREAALGASHPSLDPMRLRITELRRIAAGDKANGSTTGTSSRPIELVTNGAAAVGGLRHPSPIVEVRSATPIPELDTTMTPPPMAAVTPPVTAAVPARISNGRSGADLPSLLRTVSPASEGPSAVRWIEPTTQSPPPSVQPHQPVNQPVTTKAGADRRSSRRLNLGKHREGARSGASKVLWLAVAITIVGGGVFVFGRDLWSSVLPPTIPGFSHPVATSHAPVHTVPAKPAATGSPSVTTAGSPSVTTPPSEAPSPAPPTAASTVPTPSTTAAATAAPTNPAVTAASPSVGATPVVAPTENKAVTPLRTPPPAPVRAQTGPSGGSPDRGSRPPRPALRVPAGTGASPIVLSSPAAAPPLLESDPTSPPATPSAATTTTRTGPKTAAATRSAAFQGGAAEVPAVAIPSADVDAATHSIDDATKVHTASPPPP